MNSPNSHVANTMMPKRRYTRSGVAAEPLLDPKTATLDDCQRALDKMFIRDARDVIIKDGRVLATNNTFMHVEDSPHMEEASFAISVGASQYRREDMY